MTIQRGEIWRGLRWIVFSPLIVVMGLLSQGGYLEVALTGAWSYCGVVAGVASLRGKPWARTLQTVLLLIVAFSFLVPALLIAVYLDAVPGQDPGPWPAIKFVVIMAVLALMVWVALIRPQKWRRRPEVPQQDAQSGLRPARTSVVLLQWVAFPAFGFVALQAFFFTVANAPETDITNRKPYVDFIGREYRAAGNVSAYAWNDYPDKAKILSISLMQPPGVRNRFVSYVTPLQRGQRIRIVGAWRRLSLVGFSRHYVVSVPGAGLPEDVPITMPVNSDGVPDPRVYEPIGK